MAKATFKYRDKLLLTKRLIKTVFYHDEEIIDLIVASFASRSHLCLLGARGGGKTHGCEALLATIDDNIKAVAQGYLSAEMEELFARLNTAKLLQGQEEVITYKLTTARIKFFDEIQRLGPSAMCALFRLLMKGTIIYMGQEVGVRPFWVLATANPTEQANDMLNISLPEPLWDRFDAVAWVPMPRLKYLMRINGKEEVMKEQMPKVWDEDSLLGLWSEVEAIRVPDNVDRIATLMVRICQFCKEAEGYDGSSLTEAQKRELCSKCNSSYICSRIARPPSVRAKRALIRLAKGFAYLEGRHEVTLEDIKRAWPYVMRKRVILMDEDEIADKTKALIKLAEDIINDIKEAEEAIKLAEELKKAYDQTKWAALERWVNSKVWLLEVKEELESYWQELHDKLMVKWEEAKARGDKVTLLKLQAIASRMLPPDMAKTFKADVELEVELNPQVLAKVAKADSSLFQALKARYERGETKVKLKGRAALTWLGLGLPVVGVK